MLVCLFHHMWAGCYSSALSLPASASLSSLSREQVQQLIQHNNEPFRFKEQTLEEIDKMIKLFAVSQNHGGFRVKSVWFRMVSWFESRICRGLYLAGLHGVDFRVRCIEGGQIMRSLFLSFLACRHEGWNIGFKGSGFRVQGFCFRKVAPLRIGRLRTGERAGGLASPLYF